MKKQLGQGQPIFISKKDGKGVIEKFSAFFNPEKLEFKELGGKEEKEVNKLSFKPELMPKRDEVRVVSKKLDELGHGGNTELVLAFSLCLWKTRLDYREKFVEGTIPELLGAAFAKFGPADAVKALSYLHKVKQYEPKSEFVSSEGAQDWNFVAKEFKDVCANFLENLKIMQTHPQFERREVWKLFKEALKGRMTENDSVYTSTDTHDLRDSNKAGAPGE